MMIYAAALCGALLAFVTLAFVFSERFRKDVIVGEGETRIFGILNAKGAIIVAVLALLLGGTLYSASRTVLAIQKLAEKVPEEAPELAQELQSRIKAMQKAHTAVIKEYFIEKKTQIEQYVERDWLPVFSEELLRDNDIKNMIRKIFTTDTSDSELAKALSYFNSSQQRYLLRKKRELIYPLDEKENEIMQQINSEYDNILSINQSIIDLLNSLASKAGHTGETQDNGN